MVNSKYITLLLSLLLILTGCTKKQTKDIAVEYIDINDNKVSQIIKHKENKGNVVITNSIEGDINLKQFVSSRLPLDRGVMTEYNAPVGLNAIVDVDPFIGDLEDLVYLITMYTGYKYLPYSGIKVSPVRVTYETHGRTALESFVKINNLIGDNAIIKVSERAKTVQIIYPISALTFE